MIDPRDKEIVSINMQEALGYEIDIFVEEPQLPDWQIQFQKLNEKLGNEVWGARVEETSEDDERKLEIVRIFLESSKLEKKVLVETGGVLSGRKIVFTVLQQEKVENFLKLEKDHE